MATIMLMHWPETPGAVSGLKNLYEQARKEADWESRTPQGAQLHLVGFADDGMHVVDIWDSRDDFEAFYQDRIKPVIDDSAITSEPIIQFIELHGVSAPALGQTKQITDLRLPTRYPGLALGKRGVT